jgi:hypothetical protein
MQSVNDALNGQRAGAAAANVHGPMQPITFVESPVVVVGKAFKDHFGKDYLLSAHKAVENIQRYWQMCEDLVVDRTDEPGFCHAFCAFAKLQSTPKRS